MADELSDTQREESDASNTNTSNGITEATTNIYEVPLVDIDEDSDGQEEPNPIEDEGTTPNVETEGAVVVKTADEEY